MPLKCSLSMLVLTMFSGMALALEPPTKAPKTGQNVVDHTKAENVLDAVFRAARTSNARLLSGLCDPKGEGDQETRTICGLSQPSPEFEVFKANFEKGVRISAVPRIRGNRAVLNFLYGGTGKRPEQMNLIQRNGLWYLLSF